MIVSHRCVAGIVLITLAFGCCTNAYAAKIKASGRRSARVESMSEATSAEEIVPITTSVAAAAATGNAGTTAVQSGSGTTALSFWGMVRSMWNWVRDDLRESFFDDDSDSGSVAHDTTTAATAEGRTFGKIRRLQMALIPIIFKFGVLSAMVAFLVVLGMKTLFLVKLLVLMNAIAILAKFLTFKTGFGHSVQHGSPPSAPAPSYGYSSWANQPANEGWTTPAAAQHPSKEIHLHIHGAQSHPQVSAYSSYGSGTQSQSQHGWQRRNDPYSAYEPNPAPEFDVSNELNNAGPLGATQHVQYQQPINHRMY